MNGENGERWVVISAALVAGVYAYRRVTESGTTQPATAKALAGSGAPVSVGAFVTAWGVMYLIISIMETASPGFGGAFAILVAAADFLSNSPAIFNDIGKRTASKNVGAGVQSGVQAATGSTVSTMDPLLSSDPLQSQTGATVTSTGTTGYGGL